MARRILTLLLTLVVLLRAPSLRAAEAVPEESGSKREMPWVSARCNPLGLLIGRKSGDLEVWPTDHVSLVGTPWIADYDQSAQTGDKGELTSKRLHLTGLEGALRYWPVAMHRGFVTLAPFVGINGGASWGFLDSWSGGSEPASATRTKINQLIVAGEAGAAVIAGPVILELGLGVQWAQSMGTDPNGPVFWDCSWVCVDGMHFYYGNGFLPRVLTSAGFAF